MKRRHFSTLLFTLIFIAFASKNVYSQNTAEPWTETQLMNPADLAAIIKSSAKKPVILCVGPANYIPGAINIGLMTDAKNLEALKRELGKLSKDTSIVIYCGCCPFEHCPNVRPAMKMLNEMKFINQRLLNLPHNAKVDWIDKGYPAIK